MDMEQNNQERYHKLAKILLYIVILIDVAVVVLFLVSNFLNQEMFVSLLAGFGAQLLLFVGLYRKQNYKGVFFMSFFFILLPIFLFFYFGLLDKLFV